MLVPVRPWRDVTAAHQLPWAVSSPPWPFLIQDPPSPVDSQAPSRGRTVEGAGLSAAVTRQPLCPALPVTEAKATAHPDLLPASGRQ